MKIIKITLPNQEVYELNPYMVAYDRTKYYANSDGFIRGSREWDEEFEVSMENRELTDWLGNNMNWEDIKPYVKRVEEKKDYQKLFLDATIIIENE